MKAILLIFTFIALIFPSILFSQWSSDSLQNLSVSDLSGSQDLPKISLTSDGGCYIAWFDTRGGSYAVYLQRLNAQGVKQFAPDGLLISSNPQSTSLVDWDMITDDSNNAVIVFTDVRAGSEINPWAYRISSHGSFLWGPDGIKLQNDFQVFQANPKIIQTTDNNFVVAWIYASTPNQVALQRISSGGAVQWNPLFLQGSGNENFTYPSLVPSDNGSVIAMWSGYSGSFLNPQNYKLYSQKFSPAGTPVWNATQDTVYNLGRVTGFFVPKLFSDKNNGAIYVWEDDRNATSLRSVYSQRKNSSGGILFPVNGAEASTLAGNNKFEAWATFMPSTNETYLVWKMTNSLQSLFGVYGQKLSSTGARQWSDDGKVFQPLIQDSFERLLCFTKDTSVVFAYNQSIFGSINNVIKCLVTDRSGNIGWGEYLHTVAGVSSEKLKLAGVINSNNMTMLAWCDRRSDGGIYAQNINSNGTLGNTTEINSFLNSIPEKFSLSQNYPNPFNPSSIIRYQISIYSHVELKVYSVLGNMVAALVSENKPAGNYTVEFDGSNFSSGVYFYNLIAGDFSETRSMLLLK